MPAPEFYNDGPANHGSSVSGQREVSPSHNIEKKASIGKVAVSINQARDDAIQKRPQFADCAEENMRADMFRSRHQDPMATTRAAPPKAIAPVDESSRAIAK